MNTTKSFFNLVLNNYFVNTLAYVMILEGNSRERQVLPSSVGHIRYRFVFRHIGNIVSNMTVLMVYPPKM